MKRGRANDAQAFARSPAAGGQSAGWYAVERNVAGPQSGEEPRQRVQIALHVNIALAAAVNLLPLTGCPAGHVHQRDVFARDAQSFAEWRVFALVGEKV